MTGADNDRSSLQKLHSDAAHINRMQAALLFMAL